MSDHAILTSRDKEILSGEAEPEEFADFENRKAKIRSRVRRRSEALASEIELLSDFGEVAVVDEFCQTISDEIMQLGNIHLDRRLESLERELDDVEEKVDDIERLRAELDEIKQEHDF